MKPDWKDAPEWANYLLYEHHEYYWLENEPRGLEKVYYFEGSQTKWVNQSLPIVGRVQMATTPYLHSYNCESRPESTKKGI